MKKFTSYLSIGLLLGGSLLTSCHKDGLEVQKSETVVASAESVVDFQGLKVRKPAGVPQEVLQVKTGEELLNFFSNKYSTNSQARVGAALYPKGLFYETLGKIIAKYPALNFEDYSDTSLERIYSDFPDLKTEEDVKKYSHEVATYYERLVANEFQIELAKIRANQKGARQYASDNAYVQQLAQSYSVYAYHMEQAANSALGWTGQYFGNANAQGDRADCFRHNVWNAETCRLMFNLGYNKWEVLMRVRQFATAHEHVTNNGPWYLPSDDYTIMDLHNNCFGRTYMNQATGSNIADRATNIPSQSKIVNDYIYHVNNTSLIKIGTGSYILNLVYGDLNTLSGANYFAYNYGAALTF